MEPIKVQVTAIHYAEGAVLDRGEAEHLDFARFVRCQPAQLRSCLVVFAPSVTVSLRHFDIAKSFVRVQRRDALSGMRVPSPQRLTI